jgi:hypothetical protein
VLKNRKTTMIDSMPKNALSAATVPASISASGRTSRSRISSRSRGVEACGEQIAAHVTSR